MMFVLASRRIATWSWICERGHTEGLVKLGGLYSKLYHLIISDGALGSLGDVTKLLYLQY